MEEILEGTVGAMMVTEKTAKEILEEMVKMSLRVTMERVIAATTDTTHYKLYLDQTTLHPPVSYRIIFNKFNNVLLHL